MIADQGQGRLVGVVQSLAADLPVQPRDLDGRFLAALAAPFLTGEVPLGRRKPVGGRGEVARVGEVRAVAGEQE